MNRLPILKSFFNESLDPYTEFSKLQSDMDVIFDDIFGNWNAPTFSVVSGSYPKINVIEKKDSFLIVAATPGLLKEELSITFKEGVLSIKGESKQEELSKDSKFLCRELKKSNFFRSFRLDEKTIDANNITSSYENGELRVTIPKKEKEEEKHLEIKIE